MVKLEGMGSAVANFERVHRAGSTTSFRHSPFQWDRLSRQAFGYPLWTRAPGQPRRRHLRVFVVAGEPSGDALGAAVLTSLRSQIARTHALKGAGARSDSSHSKSGRQSATDDTVQTESGSKDIKAVRFCGVGGPLMQQAGLETVFDMNDIAVMGLWELLPHIFRLYWRKRQTIRALQDFNPDIVLTIDSKGFNLRLLRAITPPHTKPPWTTVHYVGPSIWAYKGQHSKKLQFLESHLDLLLVLFPFETPLFRKHVTTVCTGHPVFEVNQVRAHVRSLRRGEPRATTSGAGSLGICGIRGSSANSDGEYSKVKSRSSTGSAGNSNASRANVGLRRDRVLLLPGSRVQEVTRHLPVMLQALALLPLDTSEHVGVSLITVASVAAHVQRILDLYAPSLNMPVTVTLDATPVERHLQMKQSDVAVAVSGTVTMELAAAGTPAVVVYHSSFLTAWAAKWMAAVRFVSLPNILAQQHTVPELLFHHCRPPLIAHELTRLLHDRPAQKQQEVGYRKALLNSAPRAPTLSSVSPSTFTISASPDSFSTLSLSQLAAAAATVGGAAAPEPVEANVARAQQVDTSVPRVALPSCIAATAILAVHQQRQHVAEERGVPRFRQRFVGQRLLGSDACKRWLTRQVLGVRVSSRSLMSRASFGEAIALD